MHLVYLVNDFLDRRITQLINFPMVLPGTLLWRQNCSVRCHKTWEVNKHLFEPLEHPVISPFTELNHAVLVGSRHVLGLNISLIPPKLRRISAESGLLRPPVHHALRFACWGGGGALFFVVSECPPWISIKYICRHCYIDIGMLSVLTSKLPIDILSSTCHWHPSLPLVILGGLSSLVWGMFSIMTNKADGRSQWSPSAGWSLTEVGLSPMAGFNLCRSHTDVKSSYLQNVVEYGLH